MIWAQLTSRTPPIPDLMIKSEASPVVLGRRESADVFVPDSCVSRQHCQLELATEGVVIRDLQSTNGTIVNGHVLTREHALKVGDSLLLGNAEYEVAFVKETDEAMPSTSAVEGPGDGAELSN
ncbi:MAG: FHA domain-containing protein [Planctomycetaceae bacterium]